MSLPSLKVRRSYSRVNYFCPGCQRIHSLNVYDQHAESNWTFNEDYEKPTFTPSVMTRGGKIGTDGAIMRDDEGFPIEVVCHSYVTDGNIQFLPDSTHELAGQTVPVPDLPAHLRHD